MKLLFSAFLLLLPFILPGKIFAADVVLNEIYANPENEDEEFIELYNTTDAEIDISGYKISDKSETYTLPAETKVSAKSFYVLNKSTSGIILNNSDEEIALKNSTDNVLDSYTYANTIENKSWSRVPDGTGAFVNNADVTKAAANVAPPTSTPTVTPTPTKTPSPTKTPTPTDAPTPTKQVSPTKKPTPTVIEEEDDEENKDDDSTLSLASEERVKFEGEDEKTPTPSQGQVLGESTSKIPLLFIALGLIFIVVCGILAYFQFGEKILPKFLKKGSSFEG